MRDSSPARPCRSRVASRWCESESVSAPDFVAIGHVTLDRFGDAVRPGGAALYAAITAHRLGLSVGVLTSHADDFPIELLPPQIEVVGLPAQDSTTFEHTIRDGVRTMAVRKLAE